MSNHALTKANQKVDATPPVRRLANRLGVALADVAGTGPAGAITPRDVRDSAPKTSTAIRPAHARAAANATPSPAVELASGKRVRVTASSGSLEYVPDGPWERIARQLAHTG